ncbi:uncharacterized protein LOC136064144 [Quercus suber]|uniref:uncharacterized protein LOC136064144 n=1 Tax=Quercus suber TaxID=58331 RepID=UPI0032E02834
MSEVLYRATKYMNAEDALLAREERPKKRERRRHAPGPRAEKTKDRGQKGRQTPKTPKWKVHKFHPLNAPIDQVLMQIKDEEKLTFPGKLKSDPSKRSRDKYCRFHRDHGHDTAECYDLKHQIEALIRQGKLQKFINKEKTDHNHQELAPGGITSVRDPHRRYKDDSGGTASTGSSKKARKMYLRSVLNVHMTGSRPNTTRMEALL